MEHPYTETDYLEALAFTEQYAPKNAPLGWEKLPCFPKGSPFYGYRVFQQISNRLAVIVTATRWPNDSISDRVWLHVALSRPDHLPSYQEMCEVKRLFVGAERKALQVFSEESQHVNIHPYCLHLWCAVQGGDGLPAFGMYGTL